MDQSEKQNKLLSYNAKIQKKYRQSNNLVESPYSQEFSAHEIKLFEIAASSCNVDDIEYVNRKNDKEFVLSNSELARLLNTKPNVISMEIEKTAARIMKKTIHLRKILDDNTVEFQMISMIPYAEYRNGLFKFRLNYSLIPYLLEINRNFTEFQLNYILSMSSSYAIKLYKLLYQYKTIGFRKFTVDALKIQFGVSSKYKQYGDFKKSVIEPSVKQINIETDLKVSYSEKKIGRKISEIEFRFNVKQNIPLIVAPDDNTEIESNQELNKIISSIEDKISAPTEQLLRKYCKNKGILYVKACVEYVNNAQPKKYEVYLKNALDNNWAEVNLKTLKSNEKRKLIEAEKKIKEKQVKVEADKMRNEIKKEIINQWDLLHKDEQQIFIDYSNVILEKYRDKLMLFKNIEIELLYCLYAISNKKSYDSKIENYCIYILGIDFYIR